jgi:hypothetical protein
MNCNEILKKVFAKNCNDSKFQDGDIYIKDIIYARYLYCVNSDTLYICVDLKDKELLETIISTFKDINDNYSTAQIIFVYRNEEGAIEEELYY